MIALPQDIVATSAFTVPRARTPRPNAAERTHVVLATLIVLASVISYVVLDRTLAAGQAPSRTSQVVEARRLLAQRVADLAGRYADGKASRSQLIAAIDGLSASATLPDGRRADALEAAYSGYAARARRVAAMPRGSADLARAAAGVVAENATTLAQQTDVAALAGQTSWTHLLSVLRIAGIAITLTIILLAAVDTFAVVRPLARRSARLATAYAQMTLDATTDPLTGLMNRRGFQDRSAVEFQKAKRYNRPLSLLIIDPDQLEPITKSHGDEAGDVILRAITATFSDSTRTTDAIARVGDEEFAILLPETDVDGAKLVAERLRRSIGDLALKVNDSIVSCTVSIGIAMAENDGSLFWPTFQRADRALWEAKMRGRNRVFVNAA